MTKNKYQMVYYKYLFQNEEALTPNEGLVYSELLLHSLISNKHFMTGELLCIDAAKQVMDSFRSFGLDQDIEYYPMDITSLMKHTELTFPTVKKVLYNLKKKEYIKERCIKCSLDIITAGYIKIPYNTGLKGHQLIFYAFLLDRSLKYKNTIDTWAYRFKELCGIEEGNVYFLINKLKKAGLVERLRDGTLKVYKPNKIGKTISAFP